MSPTIGVIDEVAHIRGERGCGLVPDPDPESDADVTFIRGTDWDEVLERTADYRRCEDCDWLEIADEVDYDATDV